MDHQVSPHSQRRPVPASLKPLPRSFYRPSASAVAPALLGHFLLRRIGDQICGGEIVETEAYLINDPACHGYKKQTPRNAAMYGEQGHAYVYLIYGYHFCFNAVCQPAGIAEAVLVRAIEPSIGLETMQANRKVLRERDLTNGPAKLCAAMQIDRSLDAADICDNQSPLFIAKNPEGSTFVADRGEVVTTTRIGITQAADWPLRFYLSGSTFVSRR
jgi:DNA-3-methyladenine glycosylase